MIDYNCPECGALSRELSTTFYRGDGAEIERYECRNAHHWKTINGRKVND